MRSTIFIAIFALSAVFPTSSFGQVGSKHDLSAQTTEVSFWKCSLNGRLKFRDGSDGCLENYPEIFEAQLSSGGNLRSYYVREQFVQIALTNDPGMCPFAIGVTSGYVHAVELSNRGGYQHVPRCEANLKSKPDFGPHCGCQELEAIAGGRTKDEFEHFMKLTAARARVGSGRVDR